ncbi:YtpI family protein [Hazenella coriacea]|uniref:YtpI-like protein n=1 Tax=Hazenella coriacea TaxID=1179467 RepID=A0A4R3LBZ3_9BACL|nr:YtpI family protein [Hazenella coriacea]TCS96760.1 YtpI-like protein [Hazenella coriacea]
MMNFVGILILVITGLTLFGTLFYSIMSRRTTGTTKQLYRSYMNMSMGTLFVCIAVIQWSLPGSSWLRLTLIFLIFALGLINVYYGFKNWRYFRQTSEKQ